jgi:hypothetical protein
MTTMAAPLGRDLEHKHFILVHKFLELLLRGNSNIANT